MGILDHDKPWLQILSPTLFADSRTGKTSSSSLALASAPSEMYDPGAVTDAYTAEESTIMKRGPTEPVDGAGLRNAMVTLQSKVDTLSEQVMRLQTITRSSSIS